MIYRTSCGYMDRSALVHWGHNPAPDVAGAELLIGGGKRFITWSEVMEVRRERQRERLAQLQYSDVAHAWKIEVSYFDQDLLGGWQAMLYRLNESSWVDKYRHYIPILMQLFPLTLFGWEDWKPAFAHEYKRRRQDGHPVGVRYLWMKNRELSLNPPSEGR